LEILCILIKFSFRGEIAIDDIISTKGYCLTTQICDFESNDLCGYRNDLSADFFWSREQGTEDFVDHSYGTSIGHFMRADTRSNATMNSKARLLSPVYSTQTLCAQFWYLMHGYSQLSLKTYSFGAFSLNSFFRFRGSNGNQWAFGQATVTHPYAFQLAFETSKSSIDSNGYTLLDDIEVKFKTCSNQASCNFEDDFCGFSSLKEGSDFEWLILDGQFGINQNIWLVPQFDNTIGSQFGRFIYLDGLRSAGQKTKIQSELLVASSSLKCLQFYVFMKRNGGILNVYRINKLSSQSESLYTENGNLDNLWYEREIQLDVLTSQGDSNIQDIAYTLIFEGITQNSEGALAIDDIKLYNGNCSGTQVLPTIFDCKNGQIVNSTVVCDFKEDCSNGFDEKYCGTCDFENYDSCGWYDYSISSAFFWQRNRNGTQETNKPTNDHTLNSRLGTVIDFIFIYFIFKFIILIRLFY
jgi:hypothetical protein